MTSKLDEAGLLMEGAAAGVAQRVPIGPWYSLVSGACAPALPVSAGSISKTLGDIQGGSAGI